MDDGRLFDELHIFEGETRVIAEGFVVEGRIHLGGDSARLGVNFKEPDVAARVFALIILKNLVDGIALFARVGAPCRRNDVTADYHQHVGVHCYQRVVESLRSKVAVVTGGFPLFDVVPIDDIAYMQHMRMFNAFLLLASGSSGWLTFGDCSLLRPVYREGRAG